MLSSIEIDTQPLGEWVFNLVGLEFSAAGGAVQPGEPISAIGNRGPGIQQLEARWGLRPAGKATSLTDAEAETVAVKDDYRDAFGERRCVIPCSRWWLKDREGQRYSFQARETPGLMLAGLWFPMDDGIHSILLTTRSTAMYAEFDSRMPLLLPPTEFQHWIDGQSQELTNLLQPPADIALRAEKIPAS